MRCVSNDTIPLVKTTGYGSVLCCPFTTLQKISAEYEALLREHEDVKKRLEAAKARSRTQSNEIQTLKVQIATLSEKNKHDVGLLDTMLVKIRQDKYSYFHSVFGVYYVMLSSQFVSTSQV